MGSNILPEVEFLAACARMAMLPEDVARAESAVRRQLDWNRVLSLAHSHGVLAMVHRHAGAGVLSGLLPSDVVAKLHSAMLEQARRNLRIEVFRRQEARLVLVFTLSGSDTLTTPLLSGFSCSVTDLFAGIPAS